MKLSILLSLTFSLLLGSAYAHKHHHHHHHHHRQEHKSIRVDNGLEHHGKTAKAIDHSPAPGSAVISKPGGAKGGDHVTKPSGTAGQGGSQPGGPAAASGGQRCEETGGIVTQFWDCCKPPASLPGHSDVTRPIDFCARDGITRLDDDLMKSGCQGGDSYSCSNHAAFTSPTNPNIAYAVGARWSGHNVTEFYSACYAIKFDKLPGKTLIFQAVNAGWGYEHGQVDIQTPGGGEGQSPGCVRQWAGQYLGGVETKEDCAKLPIQFRNDCHWRFDWLSLPDHPHGTELTVASMCRVRCPSILTNKTGSVRKDDDQYPEAPQ
ncbi:hypothetical protein V8E36_000261 [Tilletia maclaganii]